MSAPLTWQLRDRILTPGAPPLVLGIVNVTPDSFSDGGRFLDTEAAVARACAWSKRGPTCSTLAANRRVPARGRSRLRRNCRASSPWFARLAAQTTVPLSVDTNKAEVARQALEAGAHIINDITALQGDPAMPDVVRSYRAGVILMHMQGTPATMQTAPRYANVVEEVAAFLQARLQACADLGIAGSQVVLDPGIGFGKTTEHNVRLLAHLEELQRLGRPVCLGVSRKGFLGKLLGRPLEQRLAGSLAAVCFALVRGTAQIVRVHDVAETRDAVVVLNALRQSG